MPYVGRGLTTGAQYQKLDAIAINNATTFTMSVGSANVSPDQNHLILVVNGVIQEPGTGFTVSGSTCTLASAITTSGHSGTDTIYGVIAGDAAFAAYDSIGVNALGVTAGTVTASRAVVPDSNKDIASFRNVTLTGELDAATLDISGNADIDGTLEADAITVDGTALATYIRDTVGTNMVSSNTESGITVTYDTSNDNIDFAVDAAQTGITSLLATDIKIGEDDQTKIDFETADEIHLYAANAEQVYVADGVFGPQTDSDVDLGSNSVRWKDAYVDSLQVDNVNIDGNTITTTNTNGTLTITPNGTGNVDLNTDRLNIQGTEGESTSIRLSADEGDDSGDDWLLLSNTDNTFTIGNDASGSNVAQITLTPNSTVASSTTAIAGNTTIAGDLTIANNKQILGAADGVAYSFTGDTDTGIQSGGTNTIQITTAGSKAMDFDGNQLATFAGELRVNGGQASIYGAEGADAVLELNSDEADDNADRWQVYVDSSDSNNFKFRKYSTGSWVDTFTMSTGGDATFSGNIVIDGSSSRSIEFYDGGEREGAIVFDESTDGFTFKVGGTGGSLTDTMVMSSGGCVSIGTSGTGDVGNSPGMVIEGGSSQTAIKFQVRDTDTAVDSNNVIGQLSFTADDNADAGKFFEFADSGGVIGSISANGAGNTAFNTSSDERLKKDIEDVSDSLLDEINKIKVRKFQWNHRPANFHIGLIAQELEKIIPKAVNRGGDDPKKKPYSVAYSSLVPYLIKAVQELSAKVEALEGK